MRTVDTTHGVVAEREILLAGVRAGSWRIEHLLGRGGMGDVYAVVHDQIGKRAAMKVMHRQFASNDRVRLEGQVVNHVDHPNIVDIFEAGTVDGRPYLVMERLEGMTLAHLAASTKILPPTVIDLLLQLCRPLAAAHAAGVIHRDLKPDNIFLIKSAEPTTHQIKVLDWGIAKILDDTSRRTREGQLIGTPNYLSPEQACGRPVSSKTDIYALGVIAYELFLEQLPFDSKTPVEMLTAHFREPPQVPHEIWPDIPAQLELLLLEMLAKDPNARPTLERVERDLREIARELDRRRRTTPTSKRPSRRRRRVAAWLAGVLAVVASTAVWTRDELVETAPAMLPLASPDAVPDLEDLPFEIEQQELTPPPPPAPDATSRRPASPRTSHRVAHATPIVIALPAPAAPVPPVMPAAIDSSTERVAAKYVAVGRQLKVHREARDIDVSDLWPRYRLIQINAALSTAETRMHAARELTRIQQDINARCELPR